MASILIIDDDPMSRDVLRVRLEKSGYQVLEATDGEEGLKIAEEKNPNLVFLDVRIPKLDGWEVCRRLKNSPRTKSIPVVMLTGCSQDVQELYGRQCGADEYITKPWDSTRLGDVVRKMLARSSSSNEFHSEALKTRVKQLGQQVMQYVSRIPPNDAVNVMTSQISRAISAMVAHYQSCFRTTTLSEFKTQIESLMEETDNVCYWMDMLANAQPAQDPALRKLLEEAKALNQVVKEAGASVIRNAA